MEQNRDDRVSFELMERIPLQELSSDIAVIRNVEVTPEIEMIAEYSSYRIRGALIFTGEYEARKEEESNLPHLLDRSAHYNKRLVKKINHRIPVDISLPADRIDDNGVVMEITSLDYDLAEPNHLVVTTELELQGVLKEEVVKNTHWDQATQYDYSERDVEEDRTTQPTPNLFADEFNDEEEQPREYLFEAQPIKEEPDREPYMYSEDAEQVDRDPAYENFHHYEQQDVNVYEEPDTRPEHDEYGLEEQEEQLDGRTEEEEIPVASIIEEREPEVKVTISNRNRPVEPVIKDTEKRTESEQLKEDQEKASRANTVGLLSKFLKNRDDSMAQLQVCIVQPGETIAEIAKRYDLLEEDIRATNNLGFNSNVSGKVLKIPVRKVR